MSITGTLETMPLPDLVQFLGLGRKTGVLRVETPGGRKRLVLEEGQAVYCSSDNPKEYLGQHLLARTDLTESDLETAFRLQRQTGQKLGEVLVSNGFLTKDELERVLRHKIEDSMFELFTWSTGSFEFEEGPTTNEDIPVRVRLPWADLVMEGARRTDEMAVIRKVIPGPHVRLKVHRDCFKPGFPRTGGDRKLVELAEEGLTVGEILPRFHASDFDILTRLSGLVQDGAFEPLSSPAPVAEPARETADAVLRRASLLMQAERVPEAYLLLRDAVRDHFEDPAVASAMAACEAKLRRRYAQMFPDRNVTLSLTMPLERLAQHQSLDSKEAFLASRMNGAWPLQSVVQLCPFDELEALCLLERLLQKGIIELRAPVRA